MNGKASEFLYWTLSLKYDFSTTLLRLSIFLAATPIKTTIGTWGKGEGGSRYPSLMWGHYVVYYTSPQILICWFIKFSVQTFQPLFVKYRRGNLEFYHWRYTSIYRSLSYPLDPCETWQKQYFTCGIHLATL